MTRDAHDRLARGQHVPHDDLSWMLKEAARKNVYPALRLGEMRERPRHAAPVTADSCAC